MSKLSLTDVNIIRLLGIESLPMDQRQEIVMNATELVETRMLARILEALNADKKEKLGKILGSEDTSQLSGFFQENNIDYLAIAEEETEKVKQELLEAAETD